MKIRSLSVFKSSLALLILCAVISTGCATNNAAKLPPPPPKYVSAKDAGEPSTVNSLWRDGSSSLLEDFRARRVNDLLTINVMETMSGSGGANTST
ncbi:MAG: flagellar basal body L-ring protein FlgH, partial [Syntrophorhabdaceae bacterium]|nr:flagellar basal body L-ring protein FlgH [Syntrophorhabdaceae bacterium]